MASKRKIPQGKVMLLSSEIYYGLENVEFPIEVPVDSRPEPGKVKILGSELIAIGARPTTFEPHYQYCFLEGLGYREIEDSEVAAVVHRVGLKSRKVVDNILKTLDGDSMFLDGCKNCIRHEFCGKTTALYYCEECIDRHSKLLIDEHMEEPRSREEDFIKTIQDLRQQLAISDGRVAALEKELEDLTGNCSKSDFALQA